MIRLGFITEAHGLAELPLVRAVLSDGGPGPGSSLQAEPDGKGRLRFELSYLTRGDGEDWARGMAESIKGLGWQTWLLETASVRQVAGKPLDQALIAWGENFWPALQMDCDVLMRVDNGTRGPAYQAVRAWEKRFPFLRFSRELDYENRGRDNDGPANNGRNGKTGILGALGRIFHGS